MTIPTITRIELPVEVPGRHAKLTLMPPCPQPLLVQADHAGRARRREMFFVLPEAKWTDLHRMFGGVEAMTDTFWVRPDGAVTGIKRGSKAPHFQSGEIVGGPALTFCENRIAEDVGHGWFAMLLKTTSGRASHIDLRFFAPSPAVIDSVATQLEVTGRRVG